MKDMFWNAWDRALDAVDWAAGLVERNPRKALMVGAVLVVITVL